MLIFSSSFEEAALDAGGRFMWATPCSPLTQAGWSGRLLADLEGLALRLPSLIVATTASVCVASCSQEQTGYTDEQRRCISQRHSNYDAKKLDQCVDVCEACMTGTPVTCTTSCKLKGAT
jgi:hypothetical protein